MPDKLRVPDLPPLQVVTFLVEELSGFLSLYHPGMTFFSYCLVVFLGQNWPLQLPGGNIVSGSSHT